jgi:hypothetical protein
VIRRLLLFGLFLILVLEVMHLFPLAILPGLSYKNLAVYLLLIMLGVRAALSEKRLRLRDPDIHAAFLGLIIYVFLTWSIASAFDPTYDSWRGFIAMKGQWIDYYLLFLIYCYGVDTAEDSLWLLRACTLTLLLVQLVVFVDYHNVPDLGLFYTHGLRAEGFVGEVNQYGAFLVFFVPVAVALLMDLRPRPQWFWWLMIGVSIFMLIVTVSRGSYVAAIGSMFASAWFLRRYVNARAIFRIGGAVLLSTVVLVIVAVFVLDLWFIVERVLWSSEEDIRTASSGRLEIWTAAFQVMMEWPYSFLVGNGWFRWNESGIWKSAHSEYVHALFELGSIGLMLILVLFAVLLFRTRRAIGELTVEQRRLQIAYTFGIMAVFLAVAFVQIAEVWPIIWVYTGLIVKLQHESAASSPVPEESPVGGAPPADVVAAGAVSVSVSRAPSQGR